MFSLPTRAIFQVPVANSGSESWTTSCVTGGGFTGAWNNANAGCMFMLILH